MRICDDGHEKIVIYGRKCPLCQEIAAVKQLEKELEKVQEVIESLTPKQ